MPAAHRTFASVAYCSGAGREGHAAAADLDGTLLVSCSSFPYFFLLAFEVGGFLRAAALLLLSPAIFLVYKLFSEAAGIQMLIYIAVTGALTRDVELAASAVLPRFYAADVLADSWRVFRACGRRRVVVTANPRVILVDRKGVLRGGRRAGDGAGGGREDGKSHGEGSGRWRDGRPSEERGRRSSRQNHCRSWDSETGSPTTISWLSARKLTWSLTAYDPKAVRVAAAAELDSPIIFHDGRLVQRPDPLVALLTLLWLTIHRLHSLPPPRLPQPPRPRPLRPPHLSPHRHPPFHPRPHRWRLFVCNHRTGTALDPIIISIALAHPVACATYSVSSVSVSLCPIRAVVLSRDRTADAALIAALLAEGDVVVWLEGTTCREPALLSFSS